jgi:SAM-dependent methyltransferase
VPDWLPATLRVVYSDADVAALYDVLNPWGPSDDFHLALVMAAPTVLDVGCGTGGLLARARQAGHDGRLCGVDPDEAALARARQKCPDVEWLAGTAASMTFDGEFRHALMASNAFQCLITDEDVAGSLTAISAALVPGGTFAFETRNPLARAWLEWEPHNGMDTVDHAGRRVRVFHHVESVDGDVVTLTETTQAAGSGEPRVDRASLRFLSVERLDGFLAAAGLRVSQRYGDFTGGAFTPASPNIVTVAERV